MNQSQKETALRNLTTAMNNWPLGMQVWHRATGERMVVDGYRIFCGTLVTINLDDGKSGGHFSPIALSRAKVPEDLTGEEWKSTDGDTSASS